MGDERDEETSDGRSDEAPARDDAPAVTDALSVLVQALMTRGRSGLERFAQQGRVRMELRQLRRDRDVMLGKLGREARALVEGGEIDHPGLRRGVARLEELEAQMAIVTDRLSETGAGVSPREE